jgi:hypothetical protein
MTKRRPGWPRLQRDWVGLRVRTTRDVNSGLMLVPKGTFCTIKAVSVGSCRISADPCKGDYAPVDLCRNAVLKSLRQAVTAGGV